METFTLQKINFQFNLTGFDGFSVIQGIHQRVVDEGGRGRAQQTVPAVPRRSSNKVEIMLSGQETVAVVQTAGGSARMQAFMRWRGVDASLSSLS